MIIVLTAYEIKGIQTTSAMNISDVECDAWLKDLHSPSGFQISEVYLSLYATMGEGIYLSYRKGINKKTLSLETPC